MIFSEFGIRLKYLKNYNKLIKYVDIFLIIYYN